MKPTFSAKFLRDGSTAFQCKETGVRYIVTGAGRDYGAFREGRLIFTGPRNACVNAVESDAKWGVRENVNA